MPLDIPVKAVAFNSFPVALDEVQYIFKVIWNDREGSWRLDIFTSSEERIVSGLKLVPNRLLLLEYRDSRLPKGALGVESLIPNVKPSFESLGSTMFLTYYPEEEVNGFI